MYYSVSAQLVEEKAGELYAKLTDGTIAAQQPDGEEIVDSMERARIGSDGLVRWSEACYCLTPLGHERETVYDYYFTNLHTRRVSDYVEFEGQPLMEKIKPA
ncbi:MAG: hypothetical protein WDZ59_01265 [Pirellulales bacterium]